MKVGILGDVYFASTGFAIVLTNLAIQLATHKDLEVSYFGRFGLSGHKTGFGTPELAHNFHYVPCEGGVWKRETVVQIIDKFKLDVVFSEDDWYSMHGLLEACKFWDKPLFFLTPIDSIPVKGEGLYLLKQAKQVFVPTKGATTYLKGEGVNAITLPHGVDCDVFKPVKVTNKPDGFTFVWVGRDESRKALGRTILAYEQLLKQGIKANLLIRTDWTTPLAKRTAYYLRQKRLPTVITEQMTNCPHEELRYTYNRGDCLICSSKAGGFELGVIEAQACGLPVLCTDHTFMREQIVDGKSGFLVPIEKFTVSRYGSLWGNISVSNLSEKMRYYVENPKQAKLAGNYGREYVKQTYSWVKSGKVLYNEITKISPRN